MMMVMMMAMMMMTETWFGGIVQEAPAPSPLCASEGGKYSHLAEIALFIKVVIIFALMINCQGVTLIQRTVVCAFERSKKRPICPICSPAAVYRDYDHAHSVHLVGSDSKVFFSHSPRKYDPDLDDLWRIAIKVNIFRLNVPQNQTF